MRWQLATLKKALTRDPLLRPRTALLPQNAFCWRSAEGATILPACTIWSL